MRWWLTKLAKWLNENLNLGLSKPIPTLWLLQPLPFYPVNSGMYGFNLPHVYTEFMKVHPVTQLVWLQKLLRYTHPLTLERKNLLLGFKNSVYFSFHLREASLSFWARWKPTHELFVYFQRLWVCNLNPHTPPTFIPQSFDVIGLWTLLKLAIEPRIILAVASSLETASTVQKKWLVS